MNRREFLKLLGITPLLVMLRGKSPGRDKEPYWARVNVRDKVYYIPVYGWRETR